MRSKIIVISSTRSNIFLYDLLMQKYCNSSHFDKLEQEDNKHFQARYKAIKEQGEKI